jgi:hypothetical protein
MIECMGTIDGLVSCRVFTERHHGSLNDNYLQRSVVGQNQLFALGLLERIRVSIRAPFFRIQVMK